MNNNYELEEALAKLDFYLKICIKDNSYHFCIKEYSEILHIVENWIDIYGTEKNLKSLSKDEINKVQDIFYSIPFNEYKGYYYFEYIDAFLSKIKYFYNQYFNQKK